MFYACGKRASLALSNQSWCTFLSIDNAVPEKGETKTACRHQEVLDTILPSSDMYPVWSSLMGPIAWRGREYPLGVLPPENVVQEILWELQEATFIHELQSLDCRACHDLDLSDTDELESR